MRVAIVTESFLPHMNGVTRSVSEILRHLQLRGHQSMVIAPQAAGMPAEHHGARIAGVRSLPLPGYPSVRVGTASAPTVTRMLAQFQPDVVHLASPFALGWRGAVAADRLGVAAVAAYQTDVAAYVQRYRVAATAVAAEAHVARLHRRATLTLVPSTASEQQLRELGVDRMRRWGRGVDTGQFGPEHRSVRWRDRVGAGKVIVGYVGRLAAEKQLEDLRVLTGLPDVQLVVVGSGPVRATLERTLPGAIFLGHLDGTALAEAVASFDVFVHPGESETFGQTLQEAHASGVPVVATGRGGTLDLVRSSVDGWLYRPGDLSDLRDRVLDLVGDERKRVAFGEAGRAAVAGRTWARVCDDLLVRFAEARSLRSVDSAVGRTRAVRPEPAVPQRSALPVRRFVALGDSLTEGLCDPGPDGQLRGWADRLAHLLAGEDGMDYANLAVRSRRVAELCDEQVTRAVAMRPDLVSILIGANDLVRIGANTAALAARVESAVAQLRSTGASVVLVTPFLPHRRAARILTGRFGRFATALAGIAARQGAVLVDTDLMDAWADPASWGPDLVHLSSAGHRLLAYQVASTLGVPHAETLAALDADLHQSAAGTGIRTAWWREHALPWIWRRVRGRRAGDGRQAKHTDYVRVGGSDRRSVRSSVGR